MNCHEFATLLDENGAGLSDEQMAVLVPHAHGCKDCASALLAVRALGTDRLPLAAAAPPAEPIMVPAPRARRAWRPGLALGTLALGGAVFAGVGYFYEATSPQSSDGASTATEPAATASPAPASPAPVETAESTSLEDVIASVSSAEQAANDELAASLLNARALPDGEYFALLKIPPRYPVEAARRGLEGYALVEFTITPEGAVDDVVVVESSDPVFEQPSVEVVAQFKYKPRVVGGAAVPVPGVRNRIAYALGPHAEPAGDEAEPPEAQPEPATEQEAIEFTLDLAPVYECLRQEDLTCMELHLDEIFATARLSPGQAAQLWHVYGFIHHKRGDYERAIEAYSKAAGAGADAGEQGFLRPLQLMTIARIHYERQQYQPALDYALEYLKAAPRPSLADYVFVDRLRQLGAVVR